MSTYTVINPATAQPVTEVSLASVEQTDALIERAHEAFPAWKAMPPGERATLLRRFAAVVDAHVEELARRGALIEFTYLTCIPGGIAASETPGAFARAMMAVGPERAIMSTDFGQAQSPRPAIGMRMFIDEMLRQGVPAAAIDRMARQNTQPRCGWGAAT